jgi:hemoglobin
LSDADPHTVFDLIGEEGVTRLVRAFYEQVPTDEVLGPMYAHSDLGEAERRLREFLIYRLGGPDRYIAERGHPRLRMRHAPFVINGSARDRWLALMSSALASVGFPAEVDGALRSFFADTATFLINSDGP